MPNQLHILTRSDDEFARQVFKLSESAPGRGSEVFDLTAPDPDYDLLLDQIFAADSVTVW